MNRNAYVGRNVEQLFKNSIGDNMDVIKKIQECFGIKSRFLKAISTGIHSEKADVKMEFADGHNIDANIKAYKKTRRSFLFSRNSVNCNLLLPIGFDLFLAFLSLT